MEARRDSVTEDSRACRPDRLGILQASAPRFLGVGYPLAEEDGSGAVLTRATGTEENAVEIAALRSLVNRPYWRGGSKRPDVREGPPERGNCHLAGTPFTTTPEGTSLVTQAAAPIVLAGPTVRPWSTVAAAPIRTPSDTRTAPETTAPGLTDTKSPNVQSWPMIAPGLMCVCSPDLTFVEIRAPAQTTLPGPSVTMLPMVAAGCTTGSAGRP